MTFDDFRRAAADRVTILFGGCEHIIQHLAWGADGEHVTLQLLLTHGDDLEREIRIELHPAYWQGCQVTERRL